jgi:hypothetical protein
MGPQAACLVEAEPRAARPGEFPPSRLNRLSPNTNPAKASTAAWRCLLIYGDFQTDAPHACASSRHFTARQAGTRQRWARPRQQAENGYKSRVGVISREVATALLAFASSEASHLYTRHSCARQSARAPLLTVAASLSAMPS